MLYLDGELKGSDSAPGADTAGSGKFLLGAWDDRFGVREFLSGIMDEVAVYDRALSEAEVLAAFNGDTATTTTVTVNNVAPTADFTNDGPVDEGSPATVSFSNQFDPSSADATAASDGDRKE